MSRKFLYLVFAATMILITGAVCAKTQAEEYIWENNWEYTYNLLEDKTAEITGIRSKESEDYAPAGDWSQITTIEIPVEIDSYVVSGIAKKAFSYWSSVTEISIPESVKVIGESAFEGCSCLTTLKIADGVETIGKRAFAYCDALNSVQLPDSITKIEGNSFQHCSGLTQFYLTPDHPVYASLDGVLYEKEGKKLCIYPYGRKESTYEIPEDILEIGSYAFSACDVLRSVEIPSTVKKIGSGAFAGCTSLTEFTIPDSVEDIGSNPFRDCTSLEKFHISPDQPKFIDIDEVLFDKTKKKLITFPCNYRSDTYEIPEGIAEIGAYAFADCLNINEVKISSTVQVVGDHAFENCENLPKIVFPEGLISIGKSAFAGCTGFDSFSIPSTVNKIDSAAFDGCYNLKSIEIPPDVKEICNNTFRSCFSLETVIIPEGVTAIGSGVFQNCYNISKIKIPDSVKDMDEDAFEGCSASLLLIVERKSKARKYARKHNILYTYTDADSWLHK